MRIRPGISLCLLLSSTFLLFSVLHAESQQVRDADALTNTSGFFGTQAPGLRFRAGLVVDVRLSPESEGGALLQNLHQTGAAVPRSIVAADFDGDGTPDLLSGYARTGGGFLTLQRGNPAVMGRMRVRTAGSPGPSSDEEGPFFPDAQVIETGLVPDAVYSGDFDADGLPDVLIASLDSTELMFLPGLGDGSFAPQRRIELPGRLTALAVGDVNRRDGLADVVVGVELDGVARLLVFEGPRGALRHEPEQIELPPGAVVDIALTDLNRGPEVDIVAALENEIVIASGRDRQLTRPLSLRAVESPEITVYPVNVPVAAIAAGDFAGGNEPELALLLTTGELRILDCSDAEPKVLAGRFAGVRAEGLYSQVNFQGGPPARLTRLKSSTRRHDDLALVTPSRRDLRLLLTGPEGAGSLSASGVGGEPGESWPQAVYLGSGEPLAVLPLRINTDGLDDLLVLTPTGSLILPTAAGVTLTVNDAGSDYECKQPSSPSGRCTIRGALIYANTHPNDAPFQIEIAVKEITLEAIGVGFQDTPYIPPLVLPGPTTINGNGVVIKGKGDARWGAPETGEKSAAFHLFRYGAKDASNSTIRGVYLDANGPAYGIYVEDVTNITIESCRFGDEGAIPGGITLINTTNSTIWNNEFHNLTRAGVEIRTTSSGIQVLNNYFGADKSGALPASAKSGLDIGNPALSCTIQSNQFAGIADTAIKFGRVSGTATGGAHLVLANTIGLNPGQGRSVPNRTGIRNSWHPGCTIGGTSPGQANVIAGNTGAGVRLEALSDGTKLVGNLIGINTTGSTQLGNGEDGVVIAGKDLEIGGTGGAGNIIAFNGTASETAKGVWLSYSAGTGNKILGNSIHSNRSLGIGFSSYSDPTPNDPGDADTGPNNKQNFPVLTQVPNSTDIDLTLDSTPNTAFTIQVFANDECDPSGYGEGQTLFNTFELGTAGDGSGQILLSSVPEGKFITATATDAAGNTSEFSACSGEADQDPYVVNSTGDDPDGNYDPGKSTEEQPFDGICSTGKKADGSDGTCNPSIVGDCECTLRAAIQEANYRTGKDKIHFQIGGDSGQSENTVQLIRPESPLPDITDEVFINGYTQPGSREASASTPAALKIELDGSNAGQGSDGLVLTASDSEVRGLTIHSFDRHGIVLEGSNNQVAGNYLGVDPAGSEIRQPESSLAQIGVWVFNAPENLIGGEDFRDRNLIAGFTIGLQIFGPGASGNEVYGNLFCTDAAGETLISNKMCSAGGINVLQASGNIIGGKKPNIIGGTGIGITISEGEAIASVGNQIQGNLIGTNSVDPLSGRDLGNWVGIVVKANDNLIGGASPGQGNTVAFSPDFQRPPQLKDYPSVGVLLNGKSRGNHIQGNLIRDFPDYGVMVTEEAAHNVIGGPDATFGNTITGNRLGVLIESEMSIGNQILSNRILGNQGMGISLNHGIRLENDRNDEDGGPNEGQNTLEFRQFGFYNDPISFVTVDPQGVVARAKLDSLANEEFEVQFFAAYDSELSRNCQGERYLGKRTVSTNLVGNAYVYFRIPSIQLTGMNLITATVTNSSGSTSEFARCAFGAPDSDGDGIPDKLEDSGPNGGDSDGNGKLDSTEKNVAVVPAILHPLTASTGLSGVRTDAAELILDNVTTPSFLETYILGSLKDKMPLGWAESRQLLSESSTGSPEASAMAVRQPNQSGTSVLTYYLANGVRVSGFYNYGPTPDDPVDHLYEFLFDGTTGAELFDDRIEVHFVDGSRGDHDLSVNGVIQTLGGPVINSSTFYFAQLGDGLAGNIQFETSLVFENAGGVNPVQVDLADSDGRYLDLEFEGLGSGSLFEFGLAPGEALSTKTPGADPLKVGYARVIGAEGLGGTAIFGRSDAEQGILLYETGVPAARTLSDFSLFVDSLGNRDTGLALAYPRLTGQQQAAASVTLRLYDKSFESIATRELTLSPGEHLARFVRELFPDQAARAAEMEGVVTVESDQPIAAVTLRQNDDPSREFPDEVPTLTAFPVISGRADGETSSIGEEKVFYFAQAADGAVPGIALRTSMIFVNAGEASQLRIELYDSSGSPMALDLGAGQPTSVLELDLGKGEAISLQSPGTGNLKVGYAKITADSRVGGTAVFTLIDTPTGTLLYEAGVPASEPLADFSLVVDSSGERRTGLALVNPPGGSGSGSAVVTLRLYDQSFSLLAEKQLELAAGEHYARFINEVFPGVEGVTEMLGSLTVHSDVPVAAVTLRETNDPGKDFPDEVPTLSTFPVIPGRGDD